MGRPEDLSLHSEQDRIESRPPKYRVSERSQRLIEIPLGANIWVYTQKLPAFVARVVRVINTPKQPNNPQIELQTGWRGPIQKVRLGSGTSVTK